MKRRLLIVSSMMILFLLIAPMSYEKVFAEQAEYSVVKGDNLTKIARKHGVSVRDLMSVNDLTNGLIIVGQKLIIPGNAEISESADLDKPVKEKSPFMIEEKQPKIETPTPKKTEEKPIVKAPKQRVPAEKQETVPEKVPVMTDEQLPAPGDIDFKWAFVTRLDPDVRNKVVNIAELTLKPGSKKPAVTTGDKISLYFEPGDNTYVYMYLVDSRGNLELLFPSSMEESTLKTEFSSGKSTYIPSKHEWFTFDENKGTETFYLVVSSDRLNKLEQVTRDYMNGNGDKEIKKQMVINEIKGKKKLVAFNNPIERPLTYGGRLRGVKIDIAKLAVEVKGKNLYIKTIRLKHE